MAARAGPRLNMFFVSFSCVLLYLFCKTCPERMFVSRDPCALAWEPHVGRDGRVLELPAFTRHRACHRLAHDHPRTMRPSFFHDPSCLISERELARAASLKQDSNALQSGSAGYSSSPQDAVCFRRFQTQNLRGRSCTVSARACEGRGAARLRVVKGTATGSPFDAYRWIWLALGFYGNWEVPGAWGERAGAKRFP